MKLLFKLLNNKDYAHTTKTLFKMIQHSNLFAGIPLGLRSVYSSITFTLRVLTIIKVVQPININITVYNNNNTK